MEKGNSMTKKYKRLRYHHFECLVKILVALLVALIGSIFLNQWFDLKGLIIITGIGVLSLITTALATWKYIKYAFLMKKFIITNDLLQADFGDYGRKKVTYYPNITFKEVDNTLFLRFRLDGSRISQRFYDLEQPLADFFKTLCTDILYERGYIAYALEIKKPQQQLIHSFTELPKSEHGTIQLGNIAIPWRDKLYHFLIVGRTGSGKTELVKQLMYLLRITQNVRVVYCDPKKDKEMQFFCKKYDIRYYSSENDIAKAVREFEESMLYREKDLKKMNLTQAPFNEEFLFFDELLAYGKIATKKNFEEVSKRISSLVLQGRGKQCYVCLITQRADINEKTILDGATRDNLFVRIQMGNGSEISNKMIFGSEFAHVKNYRTEKGSGLIYREGIDSKPRELLVPYLETI